MDPYELIMKKRDGGELSSREVKYMVEGFTDGEIPDYQMAAWLMAVWFKGMTGPERAIFTRSMVDTGVTLSYPRIEEKLVDKHSTGGVGDGASLALVPLVASFGVKIPMMSGRGLGHTGGTLDKLESINGFQVEFSEAEINRLLDRTGALIMGQTGEVAPADKKMYALRDVTATVDSIDLIAGSIMSKKIAEGMDALILDVKTGAGAFMKEYEDAVELARAMIEIGVELGKQMGALITDMEQPLGKLVGNGLEMKQAVEIVRGEGPEDLTELVCYLGAEMLLMADKFDRFEAALEAAQKRIKTGQAADKLAEIVAAQSGDPEFVENTELFPKHDDEFVVRAVEDGFVGGLNAYQVGMAAKALGAGRETMESQLDYGAGVILEKKLGDPVEAGEPLAVLCYNEALSEKGLKIDLETAKERIDNAYEIVGEKPRKRKLIHARLDAAGQLEEF